MESCVQIQWKKRGQVFSPSGKHTWDQTHAQCPTADRISDEVIRIYYGTRDHHPRTVTSYIDVNARNPQEILYIHDKPVMGLGELGCFDDGGVLPSWVVDAGHAKYLYYTGYNAGVSVPYRNSIGVAVSYDNGESFRRVFKGPIVDRSALEPHFCAAPCVLLENGIWKMWHLSCVRWEKYQGRSEAFYHIKYRESADGLHWENPGRVCIDFSSPTEAGLTRPCVIKKDGVYRMWFSRRGIDYRVDREASYRIGYAESEDGISWTRLDDRAGIDVSDSGWDSEMIAHPNVFICREKTFMIYNGNGFGQTGFGLAELSTRL